MTIDVRVLTAVAVVSLTMMTACGGGRPDCSSSNCAGCCDSAGVCQGGSLQNACGASGQACTTCEPNQLCQAGVCQGTGGGNKDGGTTHTVTSTCAAVSDAACDLLVRCGLFSTSENCRLPSVDVTCADEAAAVKDGRMTFTASQVSPCLADFAAIGCEAFDDFDAPSCAAVFTGKVADGEACYQTSECADASYCTSDVRQACPGACALKKSAGASATADVECQDGHYVYGQQCAAFAAVNTSCAPVGASQQEQSCVSGSYCDAATLTCKPKLAVGSACTSSAQCPRLRPCVGGTCQALAGVGETCGYGSGQRFCALDLHCLTASITEPGTCQPKQVAGGACLLDPDCKSDLYCEGENFSTMPPTKGACTARQAVGASCSTNLPCVQEAYCSATSVCAARKAAGQACSNSGECAQGTNCVGGVCTGNCSDPTP